MSQVIGITQAIQNLERFVHHAERAAERVIAIYMLKIERSAKKNLSGGKSGPRRIRTGFLRANIRTELERLAGLIIASITSGVDYSVHVHFGTRHMAANTFLTSALDEHADDFVRDLAAAIMDYDGYL